MASLTVTIRARDLATPMIGAVAELLVERERRIEELETEIARLSWEAAWADATGRPWGWAPPSRGYWDVTIDPVRPWLSRVLVEDVPAAATGVSMTVDAGGIAVMRVDVPMVDVRLRTVTRQ